jgi:parallel beta-helix repeat protein
MNTTKETRAALLFSTVLLLVGFPGKAHSTISSPQAFGARGNGVTDDMAAFQKAISAGNIAIGPGTYLINGTVSVPSSRSITCQSGAVLYTSQKNSRNTAIFRLQSSYSTITGCTFEGSNKSVPPGYDASQEFNEGVELWGPGGHNTVNNNTFRYFWGNAGVSVYGAGSVSSDYNVLTNNNFENNGRYGVVVVNGRYNNVSNNQFLNSAVGWEPDDTSQRNSGNVMNNNVIENDGHGRPGGVYLRLGGYPVGFDYSGNQASSNIVQGSGSILWMSGGFTPVSMQGQSSGNQCINGCIFD